MTGRVSMALLLAALPAAAAAGLFAGKSGYGLPATGPLAFLANSGTEAPSSAPTGSVIYYRDPSGAPIYSATPRRAESGEPFVAVHASEDVSFDPPPSEAVVEGEDSLPAAAASTPDAQAGRRILYYRNPMGLPDVSETPKKDSMGMDYIPVYEGETVDDGSVTVPPGRLQLNGVRTAAAERRSLVRPILAPGQVVVDERRVSVVSTRTEAFIEDVADITAGQAVAEGAPLVSLYAREITTAAADYVLNLKNRAATEGATLRLRNLGVPAEALEAIRGSGRAPATVSLRAPRDGVILSRQASPGMMAAPGQELFRIADLSSVWVVADLPEREIGDVRPGLAARIRPRGLPGREFTGTVDLVYPEINARTRTARVRIGLANPGGALLAGMYAEVEIETGAGDPVTTVPESALIDTGDRQLVILDKGEGRFEPRPVKVGRRGAGAVEIVTGVGDGERVVVSANFLIDAESNLKSALAGMTEAEAAR